MTEDETVGCITDASSVPLDAIIDGHEFEQTSGVGDGQGRLACCSPWCHRVGHD